MSASNITCKNCALTFTRIFSYRRHVESGRCRGLRQDTITVPKPSVQESVTCNTCGASFVNKYTLQRHNNTVCKPNPTMQSFLNMNPEAMNMMFKLYESFVSNNANAIKTHNGDNNTNHGTINNTNNSNNTINNTNNTNTNNTLNLAQTINLNPLGKESTDHITKERKLGILKKGLHAVPELLKILLEVPENRNVAITDKKGGKVTYFNRDGEMEIENINKVVSMITVDNIDRIDAYLDELHTELSLKDKTIMRLLEAQGFTLPGDEQDRACDSDSEEQKTTAYHNKCEGKIKDVLTMNKKKCLTQINQYLANV